jgi:hypothetical protein
MCIMFGDLNQYLKSEVALEIEHEKDNVNIL